jgi:hypothetical protein
MEMLTWTAIQEGVAAACTSLDIAGNSKTEAKYGPVSDYTICRLLKSR